MDPREMHSQIETKLSRVLVKNTIDERLAREEDKGRLRRAEITFGKLISDSEAADFAFVECRFRLIHLFLARS